MNIEITCDECGGSIDQRHDVSCEKCQRALEIQIEEKDAKIDELESELDELKRTVGEAEDRIAYLLEGMGE